MKKGQISFEYLIIMGFVTFVIISIMGLGIFYSEGTKDRIRITQMNNFANKIVATSESIFYAGSPSKATITTYLPEDVKSINISQNSITISIQTSTGITTTSFEANVPISGTLDANPGLKKIRIQAEEDKIEISQV